MAERHVTNSVTGHTIHYRDYKRSEYKGMDVLEVEDWMVNEVVDYIADEDDNRLDIDDIPMSLLMSDLACMQKNLVKTGRGRSNG